MKSRSKTHFTVKIAIAVLAMLALLTTGLARAGGLSAYTLSAPGTGGSGAAGCWLNYTFSSSGSGYGAVVAIDGNGLALDVDYYQVSGPFTVNAGAELRGPINNITAGPVTIKLYEVVSVPGVYATNPDTQESFNYAVSGTLRATQVVDPIAVLGSLCGGSEPDGRINNYPGAAVAIYCRADGGIDVYGFNDAGVGFIAIHLSAAEVAAVPAHPAVNLLVEEFGNIKLYRLTTSEWQVNRGPDREGKTYVFIWNGCPYDGRGYDASFSLTNPPRPAANVAGVPPLDYVTSAINNLLSGGHPQE